MKNVKLKIKNEGDDGKWGSEGGSMFTGYLARMAGADARGVAVQSPGSKVQGRVAGEAEFEDWRLKTSFALKNTLKGGHRTGKERPKVQ